MNNKSEKIPLVSVIIPVYNRNEFIREAIESVLNQTYQNIEIIVVDDGSEIDIENQIKDFLSKGNIHFYRKPHAGLSDTRNYGIAKARGEYLVFLDDDDLLHPQMIEIALREAKESNAEIALVGYRYFWYHNIDPTKEYTDFNICDPDLSKILSISTPVQIHSVFIKKKIVEEIGGFDAAFMAAEHRDFWVRIFSLGIQPRIIKRCLCFTRFHNKQHMSSNDAHMQEGYLKVLQKAQTYLDPKIQKEIGLKNKITLRYVFAGWYHIVFDSKKKGREYLAVAIKRNILFLPFVLILLGLSILPQSFLAKLTLGVECLLNRRNLRREEKLKLEKSQAK